jgi:cytochrome c
MNEVASSFQLAPAYPADLATDNNFGTRWASAFNIDPSWIYMDYGAEVFVDEVDILWQEACAVDFTIDISQDTTTWTTMKTVTGNNGGNPNPVTDGWNDPAVLRYQGLSGRGRYVRINGTQRCDTAAGYSIWEMRAWGDTDSNCSP